MQTYETDRKLKEFAIKSYTWNTQSCLGLPNISGNARYFTLPVNRGFSKLNWVRSGIKKKHFLLLSNQALAISSEFSTESFKAKHAFCNFHYFHFPNQGEIHITSQRLQNTWYSRPWRSNITGDLFDFNHPLLDRSLSRIREAAQKMILTIYLHGIIVSPFENMTFDMMRNI